jgi:serine/threonine-protein kinase
MRRFVPLFLLPALLGPLFPAGRAYAQDDKANIELANRVYSVFEKSCFPCHGKGGLGDGGFNAAIDYPTLVTTMVRPGDVKGSRVYKRIRKNGGMPPDPNEDARAKGLPRPTEEEVSLVEKWIAAKAPKWVIDPVKPRPVFTLADELAAMQKFLNGQKQNDWPYIRFFTLRPLYNAPPTAITDLDLRRYRAGLSRLINSLSWKQDIYLPVEADPAGIVLAVDVRAFDWNRGQKNLWQEILKLYPYGLRHDELPLNPAINNLAAQVYHMAGTDVPVIRADWFIATASRPPLYHTLLYIPTKAYDLERYLQVDVLRNILEGQVARSGFNGSGVSYHNRMIERHQTPFGAYWKSYDFKNSAGKKNLFVFPLGPKIKGGKYDHLAFQQDGGELIWNLPNGFQAYMLIKGDDTRIDAGPIDVVRDTKMFSGTPEVVNGVSCMGCHHQGMIPSPPDLVRTGNILGGKPRELTDIIYPPQDVMAKLIDQDKDRFMRAVKAATAKYLLVGADKDRDVADFVEPVSAFSHNYILDELLLEDVARELGAPPVDLFAMIKGNDLLQHRGLYPLAQQKGATVKREVLENTDFVISTFQEAARKLKIGTPVNPR